MKEFLKNDTVTYNLMSFTGYKTLILFSLLTEGPKSYQDVSKYFAQHPYVREQISLDTLRVYINSFKHAGCTVERVREDGVSKYYIPENPFKLNISDAQKKALIKIYKTLTKVLSAEEIIALDMLLLKLANYVEDEEFIDTYKDISVLNKENLEITRQLLEASRNKQHVVMVYNSPRSGLKTMEMVAQKLVYNHNKLYVRAKGLEYKQETDFQVSRVVEILAVKDADDNIEECEKLTVVYELQLLGDELPELIENETIINIDKERAVIELTSNNEFYIKQRLLEYGSLCKVLAPEEFKNEYVTMLKTMLEENYNDKSI